MFFRKILTGAWQSIFSWQLVIKELLGTFLVWGSFCMALMLSTDTPNAVTLDQATANFLFWPTVCASLLAFAIASFKSALPATLAWLSVIPLALLNLDHAAVIGSVLASSAIILYSIGFSFHGGRLTA